MGKRGQHYDDSFRRMAVDRWIRGGKTSKEVADDLGISVNSLRAWKALYLSEPGGPQQQNLQEEVNRSKKGSHGVTGGARYSKKVRCHLLETPKMKFAWIQENRSEFSVRKMCRVLDVSESGFHESQIRPPSQRSTEDARIVEAIRVIADETFGTYGSPRVTPELKGIGIKVNRKRVERLMRENGISARNPRVFRVNTTDSNHELPVSPDLVQRNFEPGELDRIWVTDITYIETTEGFAYLTTFMDLGNREIVGWELSDNMRAESIVAALKQALNRRRNNINGLIIHSDRGVQYASKDYRDVLKGKKISQSMSRKGNCWDNAVQESFFHTLKTECLYRIGFIPNFEDLRRILFDYIEVFYNRKRRHSALGYLSPTAYAQQIA